MLVWFQKVVLVLRTIVANGVRAYLAACLWFAMDVPDVCNRMRRSSRGIYRSVHQEEEAKIKQLVKKYEDETEVEATTERRACECGTTHLWENV